MAIDATITFVDDYGRQTQKRNEGEATTIADSVTWGQALITDWLACTDLGTLRLTHSRADVEANSAGAGSNVDTGATIRCRLDNGKVFPFKIPGIKPALINPDGTIDITAAAITTLISNYMTAGHYKVSEGNVVVSILGGELDR